MLQQVFFQYVRAMQDRSEPLDDDTFESMLVESLPSVPRPVPPHVIEGLRAQVRVRADTNHRARVCV